MSGIGYARRACAHCLVVFASVLTVGTASPALAVGPDDCRAEIENLDRAIPAGISDTWVEIIHELVAELNGMDDKASVQASLDQVWAESDAYDKDPDPDGDGLALSPEVFNAQSIVKNCLHIKRMAELEPAEEEDNMTPAAPEPEEVAEDLTAPPVKIAESEPWFVGDDYPATALRDGRGGVVRYDLTITADGRVAGCQATGPAESADLESATCDAVMARARFKPATDAAGNPTVGEISGTIRWTAPE